LNIVTLLYIIQKVTLKASIFFQDTAPYTISGSSK